ncbi:MAG: hypothetical protein ACYDGO_08460 [Smithellaceae bacterium]
MKKTLVCITGILCLLAALAFAAEKPVPDTKQAVVLKATNVKAPQMNARGKVVEISNTAIKIARRIKGNVEIMEFALENPVQDVVVNDSVKIDYSMKDGKLTASRVAKPKAGKNIGNNATKLTKEKPASATK